MPRRHLTRTRLGILLAVAAGVLLGAVVGQPSTGRAASSAVPTNKTLPTISGTPSVGQTLAAARGTWGGNPTSFSFAWSRCNTTGTGCVGIPGATGKIYTVTGSDQDHTLRITVTAHNADGAGHASSAPSGVVTPGGCPAGTGPIQITDLLPPGRLEVSNVLLGQSITRDTRTIRLRLFVTACNGRAVAGAVVFATPVPYNQFAGSQGITGADGNVVLTETRLAGFPAGSHQRLLTVFARASKQGEPAFGGVSTSRIVAFPFGHS